MSLLHANDRPGAYPQSWYAATAEPMAPFPSLEGETRADVCVVGGGYTGLSAALCLAERGYDVVLLEAQRVGFGASGRNGGQVGTGQRTDQAELEAAYGMDAARALWDIAEDAKAEVVRRIEAHGIDAAHRPGVAQGFRSSRDVVEAHAEIERVAQVYRYDRVEALDRSGIAGHLGSETFAGGYLDHGAAHIHPLRFALGLANAAQLAGVRLHERSEVTGFDPAGPVVRTAGGTVRAIHVILAANGYLGALAPDVAQRVMPINNFIVATEPLGDRGRHILPGDIAAADDRFVVSYWRKSEDGRLLFGGGESYGYRFPSDIAGVVRGPLARVYPELKDIRIDYAWGGTLAITMRRLPHFAQVAPGVLSASGYSGHGVALATMAGRILAEAVAGQSERFDVMASLRTPRFPGGATLRSPLLVLAMSWYALRDRLEI